ncbi:hypothetical protein PSACC_01608 [Paramicrosporidium saccamoebae]|uniref:Uncharacterized protein n=1 Tax=Paramicrosporidium saccamoebae TaxID=1246581 RepID=A0A2H9TLC7_9FUNG|nr:hypothetical protein PSACC_01608 [Paramicrosporidium saccamoebae]
MPVDAPFDCFSKNGYEHGFCGCLRDPLYCIATYFCPCLVVGLVTGQMDGGSFNVVTCCCAPLGAYRNRRKVQDMFDHHESEDGSILAVACCPCCARRPDKRTDAAPAAVIPPAAAEAPVV